MLLLSLLACQEYNLVGGPVDVDPGEVTECGFTRIESTAYYRYDCNPVFTTTDEAWAPDIGGTAFAVVDVLGHPFYQLWYVGLPSDDSYKLGYAVSSEGTDWTPHPDNPGLSSADAQAFDRTVFQAPQAEWDPVSRRYVILYGGLDLGSARGGGGIGIITSADGSWWSRTDRNPVLELSPTGVDGARSWCWPLDLNIREGGGFEGYLAGTNTAGACEAWAFSGDRLDDVSVEPQRAFAAGAEGDWDDEGIISLNVARLHGEEHLFYVGFGAWEDHETYRSATNAFLGEAVRNDAGHWDRSADPIPVNMTGEGNVQAVAAVTVGNRIALWITDQYDGVGAVGYFLYDPDKAAEEDAGGDAGGGGS